MLVLVPAYGRDYKTIAEASNAWHDNFDFKIIAGNYRGSYINKADAIKYDVGLVQILFDKREKNYYQQVG